MKRLAAFFLLSLVSLGVCQADIFVSNAKEFVEAIGPQRTIVLQPGEYDLGSVSDMTGEYFKFIDNYDGMELEIKGVSNLTIKGMGKWESHLITAPRYGHVLRFRGCQGIQIENIKAGHGPEKGYCTGGVLLFQGCQGIDIDDCHLYGSGTEGLSFEQCHSIKVEKTIIKGCTYHILSAFQSQGIVFNKCWFFDNVEFDLVNIEKCGTVEFKKCKFRNNRTSGDYLFINANESSPVKLSKCTFEKNKSGYFAKTAADVTLKGAKYIENTFSESMYKH